MKNKLKTNKRNDIENNDNHSLQVIYTNVDGLVSKLVEVKDTIQEKKPGIMCLTEKELDGKIKSEVINVGGYDIWRKDWKGRRGGEVIILTKIGLQVKEICNETMQ